jgi:hypothetical protein
MIRTRSNLTDVMELTASYHRALQMQLLDPSARQRFAMDVAEVGKAQLEEVTAKNIDSTDRWKLSGMASKMMGGGAHTVEKSWTIGEVTQDKVSWENDNPIYRFLDLGTSDHGPRNATAVSRTSDGFSRIPNNPTNRGVWYSMPKAKKLFIPLNQATSLAYLNGSLFIGEGIDGGSSIYTNYEVESKQWGKKLDKYRRKKIKGGGTRKLIYGVDYILKDRVRGVTARFITLQFLDQFKALLRDVLMRGRERWRQEVRSQGWIQQGGGE